MKDIYQAAAAAYGAALGARLWIVDGRTRYDVTLSRAMPATWLDAAQRWRWTVALDGQTVDAGFTATERGAERKAGRAARRHYHRPPAKHTAPRTYSINL